MKEEFDIVRSLHWSKVLVSLTFAWPVIAMFVWVRPDDVQTLRTTLLPMMEKVRLDQYAPLYPIIMRILGSGSTYVLMVGLVLIWLAHPVNRRTAERLVNYGFFLGLGHWVMALYGFTLGFPVGVIGELLDLRALAWIGGPAIVIGVMHYAAFDLLFGKLLRRIVKNHLE